MPLGVGPEDPGSRPSWRGQRCTQRLMSSEGDLNRHNERYVLKEQLCVCVCVCVHMCTNHSYNQLTISFSVIFLPEEKK